MSTNTYERVNVTLPRDTLRLIDRVTRKKNRSGFVDRAVRFYVEKTGSANLKKELRAGARARAERDCTIAEEWFPVETDA
ncbi:hypothetical protein A3C21_03890 [Candidatus Kaiserbacteria bacterium RIFCSPHIGHO2_02_FULL_59_21]|uniref:Ribbon-helix-helix protein CopG domain-containing protein n=1 Tax=Candidatus Kaiserbacteria bacterium RIFCSPHIGHO2_02_FULL_59_21 TaxID=1798500 RepID=A0A1F6E306_9BACT|nr:MAG: hypothetical protein A2766_02380 [Candidatus Kaiserbacteria bacterium RIFCSPHIGHO2_01_FULL_58_22]OGG67592.1 MAG: hypothetical protein A3C21_03890 [Candidatus Kaiserbacteria bacterium RIFCSPHIGHO2_02_FULL_59_21]OGG80662.1 MAG: hypothetical protein A2952_02545 [Candidatus Kaiserbacteria bacterium RIFCSPLOWO2_01_FULL_59_34]OGG85445.1 MAG: hypothetical protein A3I47_03725 [Candidatus Kaiserbacteria bacterium RIFCSPLOWO2_02_FULL_59_19]